MEATDRLLRTAETFSEAQERARELREAAARMHLPEPSIRVGLIPKSERYDKSRPWGIWYIRDEGHHT